MRKTFTSCGGGGGGASKVSGSPAQYKPGQKATVRFMSIYGKLWKHFPVVESERGQTGETRLEIFLPAPSASCHQICIDFLDGPGDDTTGRLCFDNSLSGYFMVFAQSVWENMSGAKCLITTGPHSISVMPLFITQSHIYRRHICYPHEEHICASMTTQMWLKRETKKSGMVIIHLSHQPLFHFHNIRASQLHCTKHIPAGANISVFHLPQQVG